jgi:hypothetical protein
MKRALLRLALGLLLVLQLVLLEGLLPYEWRHPIADVLDRVFPPQRYEPHPNMDWEIETVLRQHLAFRIAVYLITAVLATGNAFLITKVWRAQKR